MDEEFDFIDFSDDSSDNYSDNVDSLDLSDEEMTDELTEAETSAGEVIQYDDTVLIDLINTNNTYLSVIIILFVSFIILWVFHSFRNLIERIGV